MLVKETIKMGINQILDGLRDEMVTEGSNVDYIQFETWIRTIARIVNFALGLIVVLLFICLPLVIVIEIVYLSIPTVKFMVDNAYDSAQANGHGFTEKAIDIVLRTARAAYKEANIGDIYRNPLIIYLKKKVVGIMIASVLIFFILMNPMRLFGLVNSIVSGAVDWLVNAITVLYLQSQAG